MARVAENLNAKLLNLIAEEMAIEEAELTPAASLTEDFDLDEIDVAELLMRAEETLGAREFHEGEWEDCRTVGDYLTLVASHLDKKPGRFTRGKAKEVAKKK